MLESSLMKWTSEGKVALLLRRGMEGAGNKMLGLGG